MKKTSFFLLILVALLSFHSVTLAGNYSGYRPHEEKYYTKENTSTVRNKMTYYTPEQEMKIRAFWGDIANQIAAGKEHITAYCDGSIDIAGLHNYGKLRYFLGYAPVLSDLHWTREGSMWKCETTLTERNRMLIETDRASREWVKNKIAGKPASIDTMRWLCNELMTVRYGEKDPIAMDGIYSMLTDNMMTCDGYTKVICYAAELLGLEEYYVNGWTDISDVPAQHAWAVVVVDGKMYAIDATSIAATGNMNKYFVETNDFLFGNGHYNLKTGVASGIF